MPSPLMVTGRMVVHMYEAFFEMKKTPFTRSLPPGELYESRAMADTLGRLTYAADRQGVVDRIQGLVNEGVYPEHLF